MKQDKIICKFCNGKGTIRWFFQSLKNDERKESYYKSIFCPQCNGKGTVLWIDEIMDRNKCELE